MKVSQNIEIKARAKDFPRLKELAEKLSAGPSERFEQEDTFFHVRRGRLKLRISSSRAELIYYQREDSVGPKKSEYVISETNNPDSLKITLAHALGIQGVVRKYRSLYWVGQTRVHLDEVKGLGHFVELEVMLREGQTMERGTQIVKDLMKKLGILDQDLVPHAYLDLLSG